MSDLRAPDPTLTVHSHVDGDVILSYRGADPPLAHRVGGFGEAPQCGSEDADHWCESDHARWFAIPCRECFPKAPPPGRPNRCCGSPDCHRGGWFRDPNLAWQVQP